MDKLMSEVRCPELREQGSMTEDATDWMRRLVVLGSKALAVMSAPEVVNGMMGATISLALAHLHHKELSAWLRRIADEVDAQGAKVKPS